MKITLSYAVELKHTSKIFYPTIKIYQRAVSFCVSTFDDEWSAISSVTDSKQRKGFAERLIHSTKSNQAKYPEFDKQFPKLPSYNIAARYFIREIEKSTSVMKWSQAVANVKSLAKRTLNTYSSYLELLSLA